MASSVRPCETPLASVGREVGSSDIWPPARAQTQILGDRPRNQHRQLDRVWNRTSKAGPGSKNPGWSLGASHCKAAFGKACLV